MLYLCLQIILILERKSRCVQFEVLMAGIMKVTDAL